MHDAPVRESSPQALELIDWWTGLVPDLSADKVMGHTEYRRMCHKYLNASLTVSVLESPQCACRPRSPHCVCDVVSARPEGRWHVL